MGKDKVKPSLGIIGVDHGGASIYSILYIYYIYIWPINSLNTNLDI